MFRNYLKIAIRNLSKHKLRTSINMLGLSVAVACCIFSFLVIQDEWQYDRHHSKGRRIYRLLTYFTENGEFGDVHPAKILPHLLSDYPQIEAGVRFYPNGKSVLAANGRKFIESGFVFADADVFDVFTLPLVSGNPDRALQNPFSILLTESMAQKYFPSQNPLGQMIRLDNEYDFTVTGVLKDLPAHSHFQFDFLASLASVKSIDNNVLENWNYWFAHIYLLLPENIVPETLHAQMDFGTFLRRHRGERFAQMVRLQLQPLAEIRLNSGRVNSDFALHGNRDLVYGFAAVSLLLLLIACFNYVNLATALSGERAKEVGMRKTLGANRQHLMLQFFGEAAIVTFFSVILAFVFVELALLGLNGLAGKQIAFEPGPNWQMSFCVLLLAFIVALLAGCYPAFFLSRFQPVEALKSKTAARRKPHFRRALVMLQFAISCGLIVMTLLVAQQLNFIRGKSLGFEKDQVIVVRNPAHSLEQAQQQVSRMKNAVLQHAQVKGVGSASDVPPDGMSTYQTFRTAEQQAERARQLGVVAVDETFFQVLGAKLETSRFFSQRGFRHFQSSDRESYDRNAVILNQAAVRRLGLELPTGKQLIATGTDTPLNIIGVVEDIHFSSLHHPVPPMIFRLNTDRATGNMAIKVEPEQVSATIAFLRQQWQTVAPEWPFQYYFMDSRFASLYRTEQRTGQIIRLFTVLAVMISSLGLFGVVSFAIESRKKEISVRRVLGASVPGIISLFSSDYVKWILLVNLFSGPLAWVAVSEWLKRFAYRIDIGWWVFAVAGGLALLIALLTVSGQAVRAALANPVESLRYE